MKKSLIFLILLGLMCSAPLNSQGSLLKKVTSAMKDELLGTGNSSSRQEAEPGCACNQPEMVLDMGGKLKLDYKELEITTMDDGSFLAQDRRSGEYYIVKNGVAQGPYEAGDPRIAGYIDNSVDDSDYMTGLLQRYKGIISKTGDKYTITMGGESYGPYASIQSFTISLSRDKFACLVMDEVLATEAEGKKMEEAIDNAKSDQERMELAMKYSQQIANKMLQNGGMSTMPKLVTNIPDAKPDLFSDGTFNLVGNAKYDDIIATNFENVRTLQGKTILNMTQEMYGSDRYFINESNTKYAYYNYGTLTLSDGKALPDCFNPHLLKTGGQVYLVYMYYSPKRNAIVQCRIPW